MRTRNKRLSCLLVLFAFLPAAVAYVMGTDDRVEAGAQLGLSPAVQQTGMIRIEGENFVSGLLTGDNCDVVVSAGHAAIYWQSVARKGWRKGELRGKGKFRFNTDPTSSGGWQDMTLVNSGYQQAANVGKDEHDWSIFRLGRAAMAECEKVSIMPGSRSCHGDLLMPGFHFDRPQTKLIDPLCSVKSVTDNGIIAHDCDSKDGSSGAPLFCRHNGKLSLLGINISGLTHRDYFDAGVYGKSGLRFNNRQHKNFAIYVGGAFYRALKQELQASTKRRLARE